VFQIGKLCILGKTNECPDVGLVEHYKMVKKKKRLHIDGWRPT
jgi:hypothetical protein